MTNHQSMTVYAIKQKSTGFYLPHPARGTGGSWVEPSKGVSPRLFHTTGHANGFLTNWLKGGVRATSTYTYDGEYEQELETIPQPHRNRDDMEVVALALVEIPFPDYTKRVVK